jgi:sec-independent protein translocase protein TatA
MFGLGPTELVLLLAIILIIFGAGKLPQVFGSLGKGIKEFRDASESPTTRTETVTVVAENPTSNGTGSVVAATGNRD